MFGSSMTFEIMLILGLVLVNGVFAMSEIAVVSSRKSRLQQRASGGDAGARRAIELAEDPSRFLSTVQIGITLVGVFAGAYGGASIAGRLDGYLEGFPAIAPYSEGLALFTVVAAITFLSLVVGELVPKRIALNHEHPPSERGWRPEAPPQLHPRGRGCAAAWTRGRLPSAKPKEKGAPRQAGEAPSSGGGGSRTGVRFTLSHIPT